MNKFMKNWMEILFAVFLLLTPGVISAQQAGGQDAPPMTAVGQATLQSLSPGQQKAVMQEMNKTGGQLTPGAVEALKSRPEFQNLSPAEVARGRELLQKQEAVKRGAVKPKGSAARETEAAFKAPEVTTREIGDAAKGETLFDRSNAAGKYQDISLRIKPFGYDFFRDASVKVITDSRDIPIPMKYVVGPGDEVRITLWGRVNASYNLTIDRDGKIAIPNLGPMAVAGMTFEQMSSYLIKQAEQVTGTSVDVSLGSLRTIPIFVLGDVRRPGAYTIGFSATMTDALLLSGGPTEIGSMRNIQLRRKDKVIQTFDLYDLLLKGDKSKDVILSAGDIVFVPVIGPYVAVAGNVRRPAIYELKNDFSLESLFALAGGIIPSAYTQQIQVERTVKNEKRIVIDIDDKNFARAKSTLVQDADIVKVFSIVDIDVNAIYLSGNVKRPGKYAFKPGMRVKDLINGPDDLQAETYFDYALIKRKSSPGGETVLLPFSLGKLIFQDDAAYNFELTPQDSIYIFNQSFFTDKPFVTVEGEIRGNYDFETVEKDPTAKSDRENMEELGTKKDPTAKSDREILEEFKTKKETKASSDREILLELKTIREDLGNDPGSYLFVAKIRGIEEEIAKEGRPVAGDVRYLQDGLAKVGRLDLAKKLKDIEEKMKVSSRIELSGNMKIKDAILGAGGLTNNASLAEGEIIRKDMKKKYTTIYFHVAKALSGDPRENLLLQDGDRIVIHSLWENVPKKSVFIGGDVTNPGSYQFTEKMTVRDLIFKAGNVLESAYLDEAELTSVEIVSGKTGNLVYRNINLRKAKEDDPLNNPVLKPNDRLLVRGIPDFQVVRFANVTGEVGFAGKYPIKKRERLSSLIERAGGYKDTAYLRGAIFTRETVRNLQQKGLTETADRMERDLLTGGDISKSLSAEEVAAKKSELEQKRRFVEYLRTLKATGRMTIKLADLRLLKGSPYDVELEDGDSLAIPMKNSVVNVTGSVMSQGSYIYLEGMGYQDYIEMTGGYAKNADQNNAFVLKVDGSARKLAHGFFDWSRSRSRWEISGSGDNLKTIEPGDTIIVPEKTEQIAWLREVRDITQIMMNAAVSVGVLTVLF